MQCAILAGGLGTRIQPAAPGIPKSMIRIGGKPFLEYQIELLRRNGVGEIVLCVGYMGAKIENHFGSGRRFGVRITYSYDGETPLGTGGALKMARGRLRQRFFVLYGDSYADVPLARMFRAHREAQCPVLMAVYRNRGRWDRSNVVFRDGRIACYDRERTVPGMEYIDYGISVFSRRILDEIPGGMEYSASDLYRDLAAGGRLAGYEVFERFYEIGSFAGLNEFRLFRHKMRRKCVASYPRTMGRP